MKTARGARIRRSTVRQLMLESPAALTTRQIADRIRGVTLAQVRYVLYRMERNGELRRISQPGRDTWWLLSEKLEASIHAGQDSELNRG